MSHYSLLGDVICNRAMLPREGTVLLTAHCIYVCICVCVCVCIAIGLNLGFPRDFKIPARYSIGVGRTLEPDHSIPVPRFLGSSREPITHSVPA